MKVTGSLPVGLNPIVRQNVLNKENVPVQEVQLKTVPIQNIQVETVPSVNIPNSKDVYLVNPQQSVNSFLVNPSYLQTTATNYQLPSTSEMISNTNDSVLRDVLLNKRVDNVVRSEVSETVDVLKGILDTENLDKQIEEFNETEEVTTGKLNTVKESTVPNVHVSSVKVAVPDSNKVNEKPENEENSALMSGINVISSDMKLVGSFLEVINKEMAASQQSLLRATQELTCAVDRQTRAFENLAEVLSRNHPGERNFNRDFNRYNRRPQFQRARFQPRRSRSRSPRRSRSATPERRIKFMKFQKIAIKV